MPENKESGFSWRCLLIDDNWGSGKTYHYDTNYRKIDNKPNIYISCFSATKDELVAQIIKQQFWKNLFLLDGLLSKLILSNWQHYMPRNRVVVFDDFERLHTGTDNYLDLLGVIDYLKSINKCRIIIICNLSKIQETKDSELINLYMERIVDKRDHVAKIDLFDLFRNDQDDNKLKSTDLENPILKKAIETCRLYYKTNKINNLRVIKTSIKHLAYELDKIGNLQGRDEKKLKILSECFVEEVLREIRLRYLYFQDYQLFRKASHCLSRFANDHELKEKEEINKQLENYWIETSDFNSGYINVIFNEEEAIVFALESLPKLLDIENNNLGLLKICHDDNLKCFAKDQFISKLQVKITERDDVLKKKYEEIQSYKEYIKDEQSFICESLGDKENNGWIPKYYTKAEPHGTMFVTEADLVKYLSLAIFLDCQGFEYSVNLVIDKFLEGWENLKKRLQGFEFDLNDENETIFTNYTLQKFLLWFLSVDENTIKIETEQIKESFKNLKQKIKDKNHTFFNSENDIPKIKSPL